MGGGGEFASTLSKAQKAACAMFLPCFYVEQCTEAMKAKEIAPGDIVTHVGGKFPQDMSDFAEMVRVMPKGTMLKILKPDGRRVDVEL
jgi:C-terminal processing protease CtpA/Prc